MKFRYNPIIPQIFEYFDLRAKRLAEWNLFYAIRPRKVAPGDYRYFELLYRKRVRKTGMCTMPEMKESFTCYWYRYEYQSYIMYHGGRK